MPGLMMPKQKPNSKTHPILFIDIDAALRDANHEDGGAIVLGGGIKPGVRELLANYQKQGWTVVGLQNEPGVALGVEKTADVAQRMGNLQVELGEPFDQIIYCIHHPESPAIQHQECLCRMPKYGLIVMALVQLTSVYKFHYDLRDMVIIGGESAKQMAESAGIKFKDAADWRAESIALKLSPVRIDRSNLLSK